MVVIVAFDVVPVFVHNRAESIVYLDVDAIQPFEPDQVRHAVDQRIQIFLTQKIFTIPDQLLDKFLAAKPDQFGGEGFDPDVRQRLAGGFGKQRRICCVQAKDQSGVGGTLFDHARRRGAEVVDQEVAHGQLFHIQAAGYRPGQSKPFGHRH